MADRSEKLRHIFPENITMRRPFIAPGQPRDPNRPPSFPKRRSPRAHARSLLQQLALVREEGKGLEAGRIAEQLQDCTGIIIDVLFVPNNDISLKSLSDEKAGIELLTVTELSPQLAQATLFIPEGKLMVLERKIREFAPTTPGKAQRNVPLVSSLESIRRAVAKSYWTDSAKPFPSETGELWWEVWLRKGVDSTRFRRHAEILELHVGLRQLNFPDRTVMLVRAPVEKMTRSAELLDSIAELRGASPLDLEFITFDSHDEAEFAMNLASRTIPAPPNAPVVCLLDTGVDYGHPLLSSGIRSSDVHTCFGQDTRDRFGNGDWHGTGSAGLVLYGLKLADALSTTGQWQHSHHLESVKCIPSTGINEPDLYGEVTKTAIARAEIGNPKSRRIIVTTVTAAEVAFGEPTSWSAAVDQLCSGYDDDPRLRRLMIVPTGNVVPHSGYSHPDTNYLCTIEDPGQSWNALTVGAYTTRRECGFNRDWKWTLVAQPGDLSPTARTSVAWKRSSREAPPPLKPDFVCEGGNWVQERPGSYPEPLDSLTPLSTRRRDGPGSRVLARFGATSGAASLAANLAARLQAEYPHLWPETIRALLVHSCRYTDAMEALYAQASKSKRIEALIRCFGYGVPDLERARYSARNELTLVIEREIQPYFVDPESGLGKTNEMHWHQLPWPSELLERLGALETRLRVTLSYFVEPNPGKRGVFGDNRTKIVGQASYPSYGLRFEVAKAREKPEALIARVNAADRDGKVDESTDYSEWDLGRLRTRGSIHSDVWHGSAVNLADKQAVVVFPVNGWWRFRHKTPEICQRKARYALVMSIETDAEAVDLYTPIMVQIGIQR